MTKVIEYYSKEVYVNSLEYVVNKDDAYIISRLTGKKTISGIERELIRDLTGKSVEFKQVFAPKNK
jgi:hypothetical protein